MLKERVWNLQLLKYEVHAPTAFRAFNHIFATLQRVTGKSEAESFLYTISEHVINSDFWL